MSPLVRAAPTHEYQRSIHRMVSGADWLASQPAREVEPPTKKNPIIVSASELSSFLRCRVQHHWRYQVGLGMAVTPERLAVGTLGHAVLEQFYALPRSKRTVKRMKALTVELVRGTTVKEVSPDSRALLEAMLIGFAAWVRNPGECEHTDEIIGLDTCLPELDFMLPLNKEQTVMVRGKIDNVFESTTQRRTIGMLEAKFLKDIKLNDLDNRIQLSVYLWALRKLYPKARRFVAYYQILRKQMPSPRVRTPLFHREPIERTAEELDQWERDIIHTALDMHGGAVYPNPMEACQWGCDFLIPCGQRGSKDDLLHILRNEFVTRDAPPTPTKAKKRKV